MDVSLYISAIQRIPGETPSEKHHALHALAGTLAESCLVEDIGAVIDRQLYHIPPELGPLLRILVGNLLESPDEVIRALESGDVRLQNQALQAKWFFDGRDETLTPSYFVRQVMSVVSMSMRKRIIKTLAVNLKGNVEIGDLFFRTFLEEYGINKVNALLVVCKHTTIIENIMNFQLRLSTNQIRGIYRVHPELIIYCLREAYLQRNRSRIPFFRSCVCRKFLPFLIGDRPNDFIDLCAVVLPVNISHDLQRYLLKFHFDRLKENPNMCFRLFSLKAVTKTLTAEQYFELFGEFFAGSSFTIPHILDYMKYFPEDVRLPFLQRKYTATYNKELEEDPEFIKLHKLLEILSSRERADIARSLIEKRHGDYLLDWCCYLPFEEGFSVFKESIKMSVSVYSKIEYYQKLIYCCILNKDKEHMLRFLQYFRNCHETPNIMSRVLQYFGREVKNRYLDKTHWAILRTILKRIIFKKETFVYNGLLFEKVLYHLLVECENELSEEYARTFLDEAIEMILDYCVRFQCQSLIYISVTPEITKKCFEILLDALPRIYPNFDLICGATYRKHYFIHQVMNEISIINTKYSKMKKKIRPNKLSILDFPWLRNTIQTILRESSNVNGCTSYVEEIRNLLRDMEPSFYNSLSGIVSPVGADQLSMDSRIRSIKTGEALKLLKRDYRIIREYRDDYLKACQELCKDKGSPSLPLKRFVRALRWYQYIPMEFISKCFSELINPANLILLGLVADGKTIGRSMYVAMRLAPARVDQILPYFPKLVVLASPPLESEYLSRLDVLNCHLIMLRSIAKQHQKLANDKARELASQLIRSSRKMKSYGFYMYLRLISEEKRRQYLVDTFKTTEERVVKECVIKQIRDFFDSFPTEDNWILMKECIAAVRADMKNLLKSLCRLNRRCKRNHGYLGSYYIQLFLRIEELGSAGDLNAKLKYYYLNTILDTIDSIGDLRNLPDDECQEILHRHLFNADNYNKLKDNFDENILVFAMRNYVWETSAKFEQRWNFVGQFLVVAMRDWDKRDPSNVGHYPANFVVSSFFKELLGCIARHFLSRSWFSNDGILRCVLRTLDTTFAPYQETLSYMKIQSCVLYKQSQSWKDFGFNSGQYLSNLAVNFHSDLILKEVYASMYYVVRITTPIERERSRKIAEIMEGLLEVDNYYAAIICIELFTHINYRQIDDKFLVILDRLHSYNHPAVQYKLSQPSGSLPKLDLDHERN